MYLLLEDFLTLLTTPVTSERDESQAANEALKKELGDLRLAIKNLSGL
jgi:hypothetical protein